MNHSAIMQNIVQFGRLSSRKTQVFFVFLVVLSYLAVGFTRDNKANPNFHDFQTNVTRNSDGSVTTVSFYLNGKFWLLELEPSKYTENITVHHVQNGSIFTEVTNASQCQYRGVIDGNPSSEVTISICNGDQIMGRVFDGQDEYSFAYYNDKQYVQRFPQDVEDVSFGKSINDWGRGTKKMAPVATPVRFSMGIVIDSSLSKALGQNVVDFCYTIVSIVNALLVKLNIQIDLYRIVTWNDADYVKESLNSNKMLSRFESYISTAMPGRDSVDFVVYFTPFLSTEGVANVGSMGLSKKSAMIVRTDPYSVLVTVFSFIHEFLHLLGVKHDNRTNEFLMAEHTKNYANAKLSNESIVELNKSMPEMVSRLLQKGQQWTPIEDQISEPSEEPKKNEHLLWWLISGIAIVGVFLIAVFATYFIRKRRQSAAQPARSDLEAEVTLATEPSVGAMPKKSPPTELKSQTDRSSTSLTDSGVTDNRSIEAGAFTATREPSHESLTSGQWSPSQTSLTIEADKS